jgi:5-methylcytosine-specific restriction endonuclease McrA
VTCCTPAGRDPPTDRAIHDTCDKEVYVIVGCLALNASFEPLTMVPLRRALRLVIDGKAEIVEADQGRVVRSERLSFPRPAVIRLKAFVHVPRRFRRQVTNTFLFARDRYRCQYCGRTAVELKPRESLTRDHLIPLSRGGTNEWTNVVTACSPCNTRKANRMPNEIGMHPLHVPVEPHFVHLSWAVRRLTPTQSKYIKLFYGSEVLHQLEELEHRHPRLETAAEKAKERAPTD